MVDSRNLGSYMNSVTGGPKLLWDGACHVLKQFSLEKLMELKRENPDALVVAPPECKKPLLLLADKVRSTRRSSISPRLLRPAAS